MSNSTFNPKQTLEDAVRRSVQLRQEIEADPQKYRVLTGDRPTGALHLGHLFGTLLARVEMQNLGMETLIVIADYQVLTDRDATEHIRANVQDIVLDYLAVGLDLLGDRTHAFVHSAVPELNQLLLPFLSLVSMAELDRNPTMKQEIADAGLRTVNALMYAYPVHQAADILAVKGTVVPVGPDQLPHLEVTRDIARRFNARFPATPPVLTLPEALLSDPQPVGGLGGGGKMSKSRGNAILLKMTADETAAMVRGATTDSERLITYEPERRPSVAALLRIAALCSGRSPESVAVEIGNRGAVALKEAVTISINSFLAPIRRRRIEYAADPSIVERALRKGNDLARSEATATLERVRTAMGMTYGV